MNSTAASRLLLLCKAARSSAAQSADLPHGVAIGAYDPITDGLVRIMGTGQDHTHVPVVSKDGKTMVPPHRSSGTVSIFELTGGAWIGK
jgi:hypothetical protein